METTAIWHEEAIILGKVVGRHQDKETRVVRQLRRRLGSIPSDLLTRLDTLTPDQLDDIGEALLDFTTTADLEQWFTRHQ